MRPVDLSVFQVKNFSQDYVKCFTITNYFIVARGMPTLRLAFEIRIVLCVLTLAFAFSVGSQKSFIVWLS